MSLTVKDILEKTFKRSFKGYDEDEVDKFLDQIIDEIKALKNENAELSKGQKSAKEKTDKIKQTEEAIMHTLVSAQKSSERMMNEAARKAELILESAESTARQKKEASEKQLAEAEQKLEIIRGSAKRFAASFANMINSQAANFEKNYQSNFGDTDTFDADMMDIKEPEDMNEDMSGIYESMPETQPEPEEQAQMISDLSPEIDAVTEPEPQPEPQPEPEPKPEPEPQPEPEPEPQPEPEDNGLMELHEINKALSELEKGDDILPESNIKQSPLVKPAKDDKEKKPGTGSYKQKYDDYSWLYENDDKPEDDDFELSFKNPKEKEELKSLIDEIID